MANPDVRGQSRHDVDFERPSGANKFPRTPDCKKDQERDFG